MKELFGRVNLTMLAGALLISVLFASCIRDEVADCPVTVGFRYNYNIKNANAFELEASRVSVWVFDSGGRFVKRYIDEGAHIDNSYRMDLSGLDRGDYTLVAWARSSAVDSEFATASFPDLVPGVSTVSDLNPRFLREGGDNVCDTELNSLLTGTSTLSFTNAGPAHCNIDMLKCTNKIRVLLMPVGAGEIDADRYDFIIEDDNAWLDYRAEKYTSDELIYKPYFTETWVMPDDNRDVESRAGDGITSIAFASMNTSRLFYEDKPRFSIVDKTSGEEVFVLENLTWYLALLATLEHNDRWSPQEYLDREDYYSITIYVNGDTFMNNKIVIKDWVVSIDNDINLGT